MEKQVSLWLENGRLAGAYTIQQADCCTGCSEQNQVECGRERKITTGKDAYIATLRQTQNRNHVAMSQDCGMKLSDARLQHSQQDYSQGGAATLYDMTAQICRLSHVIEI
jgi:hypothetical protein